MTVPLTLVGAGVANWLVTVRGRCLDWPFELSILGFLTLQLLLVGFGYKQYSVPWILLGGAFVPYIGRFSREGLIGRIPAVHSAVVAVGILYAAVSAIGASARFDDMHDASADIAFKEWLESLVPTGASWQRPGIRTRSFGGRPSTG